jgi:hypothetical protein
MMSKARSGVRQPVAKVAAVTLVDADDAAPVVRHPSDELMTESARGEFDQRRQQQALAQPADVSGLMLSAPSLERARDVREAFRQSSDGEPAESLLEELIAGEVAVAHQLQDTEAAATVLLARVVADPELALHVAKVTREIVSLNTAVRRRIEGSLSAVATLRASRLLLAAQRGRQ